MPQGGPGDADDSEHARDQPLTALMMKSRTDLQPAIQGGMRGMDHHFIVGPRAVWSFEQLPDLASQRLAEVFVRLLKCMRLLRFHLEDLPWHLWVVNPMRLI